MDAEGSFETRDPEFAALLDLARRAARTQATVLITGESGTGKSRLARWIHAMSARAAGPFIEVACANLPPDLSESILFGHERGAFTGAHESHPGRFELADAGTLFLDDVQELAPEVQAKVLRAIELRRFERLGGGDTVRVDVRIVTTLRDRPERLIVEGRLREDLYHRLNVVHVRLPALRERAGDVPVLAQTFLREATELHGLSPKRFATETLDRLQRYPWPGNVRELRHAVESAAVLSEDAEVAPGDLPEAFSVASPAMLGVEAERETTLAELERAYIDEVLRRTRGNKTAAARILGIHRKTLHDRLRRR